jgi:hypothetical protein
MISTGHGILYITNQSIYPGEFRQSDAGNSASGDDAVMCASRFFNRTKAG